MLTPTTASGSLSTTSDYRTIYLLSYAKIKLLAEGLPMQLKATSYLRLCNAAIYQLRQTIKCSQENVGEESALESDYLDLLASLCKQSSEWWKTCWVSDRGILKSSDPVIDKLLQPYGYFIEMYGYEYPSSYYSVMSMSWREEFVFGESAAIAS